MNDPARWCQFLIATAALVGICSALGAAQPAVVEGELLVKFRGGPHGAAATQVQQAFGHEVKRNFDHIGWQHIKLARGATEAQYRQHPDVIAAEPNYIFRLRQTEPNIVPNDPRYNEQWALTKIGATNAWGLTTGSSNVVVAVLDTGIRYTHEDLVANMWHNPGEIPGNGIDDDGNGYVDDVYGIDAVSHDSDPNDQPISFTYHGTACASIIGAVGNNHTGISGVNWSVQLMALRVAATSNFIASAWVAECFDYVLAMKNRGVNIRVTSNSYGLDEAPSMAVRDAIDAAGQAGILSIFAAGNASTNVDMACDYPACFRLPSMINVAATDMADNLASFSNYGATNVDLAAPGVNILVADGISASSYNPNFTGTSASCPYVAGAAALIASAYPFAGIEQIKTALLQSVDVFPALSNQVQTSGRLNVGRAILHPILSSNAPPFILASPQSQTVGVGYPVTFCVSATGTQPLDYFWQFNNGALAHTTEPMLMISSARLQDAGDYRVVLSNSLSTATSATATLTVVTNPTILAQPQSIRVLDGSNVTLRVTAAGAYPLTYQWQREGENISGATNAAPLFKNADWTMTANYRAVLSNSYSVVTSDVARLTVFTRPYIISQPQSHTVAVGSDIALSVSVTNIANSPVGFRWLRDRLPRGLTVLNNQFTAVTNFPNIQTNVAGTWSVLVTNEAPSGVSAITSSNAYLTVVVPPTNQTVQPGSSVTLKAIAVGPTPITYQWQHAGTNLPNATSPTLTLQNVQPPDAGTYSIIVANAIGRPTAFAANVRLIIPQPVFTQIRTAPGGILQSILRGLLAQQRYSIEISTALTNWAVLKTFTATNSSEPFSDAGGSDPTRRFYRARSEP